MGKNRLYVIIATLLSTTLIVALFGARLYSHSSDLGWHYALTYFLTQTVRLPTEADQHLAVMFGYPPMFHIVAAVVSTVLSSPLISMQYVALLACFGCYCVIASIILPGRLALLTGVLFLLGLLCFRIFFGGLIGYEIIDNAFYPQILGTAAFLGSMSVLSRLAGSPACYFFVAVASTLFTAWIYTLSGAWLAVGASALFLLLQHAKTIPVRWAIANIIILPLIVLFHPTFGPMVTNAEYLGAFVPSYYGLTLVMAVALAILFLLLLHRMRGATKSRTDALLIALLLSSVGGVIVQATLQQLAGLGSKYAVAKHVFLASTVFIAALSSLIVELLAKRLTYKAAKSVLPPAVQNIGIAILAVSLLFSVRPFNSLPTFEAYLADARSLEHSKSLTDLARNTLSLNKDFEVGENFAVLAAHFYGAWSASAAEMFEVLADRARPLGTPMGTRYALISRNQWNQLVLAGMPQGCLVQSATPLMVSTLIFSQCYPDSSGNAEVNVCANRWLPTDALSRGDGFDEPEFVEDGVLQWTVSTRSELEVPWSCERAPRYRIRILVAFALTEQTLGSFRVEVDGQPVSLRRRPVRTGQLFEGTLPNDVRRADEQSARIALIVPALDQPKGSSRHLGVAVRRVEIIESD